MATIRQRPNVRTDSTMPVPGPLEGLRDSAANPAGRDVDAKHARKGSGSSSNFASLSDATAQEKLLQGGQIDFDNTGDGSMPVYKMHGPCRPSKRNRNGCVCCCTTLALLAVYVAAVLSVNGDLARGLAIATSELTSITGLCGQTWDIAGRVNRPATRYAQLPPVSEWPWLDNRPDLGR